MLNELVIEKMIRVIIYTDNQSDADKRTATCLCRQAGATFLHIVMLFETQLDLKFNLKCVQSIGT